MATDFGTLFDGEGALRPYWPTFQYELQDLSSLSDAEVRGAALLQIGLLVLKYIFDPALRGRLGDILNLFHDLTQTQTALEYLGTVLYYIGQASTHLTPESDDGSRITFYRLRLNSRYASVQATAVNA